MELLKNIHNSFVNFQDHTAFKIEGKSYTYSFLKKRVTGIIKVLQETDPEEEIIGIWASNDLDVYSSILAVLFSGKGFMPLNPINPKDKNVQIIQRSQIRTLLSPVSLEINANVPKSNDLRIILTTEIPDSDLAITIPTVADNSIAYLLFTSGSTGIPKGVPITRGNLDAFIKAFFEVGYTLNDKDRCLQMFDLTFDFSIATYFTPLCRGASVYTIPQKGIRYNHVLSLLINEKLTVAPLVTSILNHLRPFFGELNLDYLKYCYFCGEALPEITLKEFAFCAPKARFVNFYGPTEATVFCLAYEWISGSSLNKSFNGIVSIGKPMGKLSAVILDENDQVLSTHQKGELCIAGAQVTPGYFNDVERNKTAFHPVYFKGTEYLFYRTGDIAFFDDEADFMYIGRFDQQVQIQGFRVELGEIEHFTREFTGISNVAAIAVESEIENLKIQLFIEDYHESIDKIKDYLKSRLPHYMIPGGITSLNKLPLNQNGKIDRVKLLQLIKNGNIN
jgi:amino acid adenylation domain-containing protein